MRPGTHIPTEDLLQDLRRVAEEVGQTPTVKQYEEHGEYTHGPFRRRFGLWSDAHREAGLEPRECNNSGPDTGPGAMYEDLSLEDVGLGGGEA